MSSSRQPTAPKYPSCSQKRARLVPPDQNSMAVARLFMATVLMRRKLPTNTTRSIPSLLHIGTYHNQTDNVMTYSHSFSLLTGRISGREKGRVSGQMWFLMLVTPGKFLVQKWIWLIYSRLFWRAKINVCYRWRKIAGYPESGFKISRISAPEWGSGRAHLQQSRAIEPILLVIIISVALARSSCSPTHDFTSFS